MKVDFPEIAGIQIEIPNVVLNKAALQKFYRAASISLHYMCIGIPSAPCAASIRTSESVG